MLPLLLLMQHPPLNRALVDDNKNVNLIHNLYRKWSLTTSILRHRLENASTIKSSISSGS
jgi:hypothetical protein